ncbi:MAG TPA: 30S ribosomal protein S4 [Candidatus Paceibacterota bacterium]
MLIVKSKYKIAKRLGAGVFDQTQTQKFSLSEARSRTKKMRRSGSDYGRQLLEKQRVRFTYGLSEKHLSNYVEKAMHAQNPSAALHSLLEMRIDNAMYRAGFASTRRAARQMVSHGHIVINGQRTTVPSQALRKGDLISIREGSRRGSLFAGLAEKTDDNTRAVPTWLKTDISLLTVEVEGEPAYSGTEGLDYATVFEFYSR